MKKSSLAVLLVAALPPLALAGCQTVEEDGYGYGYGYSTTYSTVYDDVYAERPVYWGGYASRSRSDWDRGRRPPSYDRGRPPPSDWGARGPSPGFDGGRPIRPVPNGGRRTPTWGAGPSAPTARGTPQPDVVARPRPPQGGRQDRGEGPWTPNGPLPGAPTHGPR